MIYPLYALEIPHQTLAKIYMCPNSIQTVVRSLFLTKKRNLKPFYRFIYEINLSKSSKLLSKTNLITIYNLKCNYYAAKLSLQTSKTCAVVFFNDAIHNTFRVAAWLVDSNQSIAVSRRLFYFCLLFRVDFVFAP